MDSFHKPSALSFNGNTSENWRRFQQQYDIYLTASGSEKKDDTVKIAILLNFAGEDAIEVFNTFQFPEGDEKKLAKVLEQFERYCNPRKNIVFERYQFWQIMQKDSETVDQFVTRLKSKVKSCEYIVSFAAVIRVVTQRSSPLTAAHERDTFLSPKLTNKKQASISWKPGPSPSPLLESKHGGVVVLGGTTAGIFGG